MDKETHIVCYEMYYILFHKDQSVLKALFSVCTYCAILTASNSFWKAVSDLSLISCTTVMSYCFRIWNDNMSYCFRIWNVWNDNILLLIILNSLRVQLKMSDKELRTKTLGQALISDSPQISGSLHKYRPS